MSMDVFDKLNTLSLHLGSGQVDIPAVEVADFDDDGPRDLMMQTNADLVMRYTAADSERSAHIVRLLIASE